MAVGATLAIFFYLIVPSILAATTYSRSSLELLESSEQPARTGRKLYEVEFPTNLAELPVIPVFQGVLTGEKRIANIKPIPVQMPSNRPYKTVPLRTNRGGKPRATQQSFPDLINDLSLDERNGPIPTFRPRPRIPAGPYMDDNTVLR